ncbi:MAG: hypothetical protein R3F29_03400 [Planctomycetota bacterium]
MAFRTAWSLVLLLAACASAPMPTAGRAVQWTALDGEALYTVAGGLKPMSGGFWQGWIDVAAPDLSDVRRVRAELAEWRDDELWADVHVFDQVHEGRRAALAYVIDRASLAAVLTEHRAFFAPYGLAPDTHPAEVVAVVERMPKLDRHRGQGLLFGYPEHAIDFFVRAEAEHAEGGEMVKRRFVQIPTFGAAAGRFVYAVPEDHVEDAADRALAQDAARVLARYRALRDECAAPGRGPVAPIVRQLRREFAAAGAPR